MYFQQSVRNDCERDSDVKDCLEHVGSVGVWGLRRWAANGGVKAVCAALRKVARVPLLLRRALAQTSVRGISREGWDGPCVHGLCGAR